MADRGRLKDALGAAYPIMLGYVGIGVPCGILCESVGLNALQVLLLSALFYSGAGQFMIPNMYLAGAPVASIVSSVAFVNTRQMLYSASLAPWCAGAPRWLAFLFAATVTDESFGVSIRRFEEGGWTADRALLVNLLSQSSWAASNVVGVLIGGALAIPLNIAAFAMTSIFICLLVTQKLTSANVVAGACAMVGVLACKALGLSGPAILVGAVAGVAVALAFATWRGRRLPEGRAGAKGPGGPGEDADADGAREAAGEDASAMGARGAEGCGETALEGASLAEGGLADAQGAGGARLSKAAQAACDESPACLAAEEAAGRRLDAERGERW